MSEVALMWWCFGYNSHRSSQGKIIGCCQIGKAILESVSKVIEAWTKWLPFCRQHFQMHFLAKKVCILILISLKFVPMHPVVNKLALVCVMAWQLLGDKPFQYQCWSRYLTRYGVCTPQWVKVPVSERGLICCSHSPKNSKFVVEISFAMYPVMDIECIWIMSSGAPFY